jgi:hypothetical protein
MAIDNNTMNKFNTDDSIPLMSYSCASYLVQNNELIWKLLLDKTPDSWKLPNLTTKQKTDMIYQGLGDVNNYNVFFDDFQDDAINSECTFLRIFPIDDIPQTHLISNVCIAMVVFTHWNLNHLSNYETRIERIVQQLKSTFHGRDIPKVGQLIYSQERSRACKSIIVGKTPYKGKMIVFNTYSSSVR